MMMMIVGIIRRPVKSDSKFWQSSSYPWGETRVDLGLTKSTLAMVVLSTFITGRAKPDERAISPVDLSNLSFQSSSVVRRSFPISASRVDKPGETVSNASRDQPQTRSGLSSVTDPLSTLAPSARLSNLRWSIFDTEGDVLRQTKPTQSTKPFFSIYSLAKTVSFLLIFLNFQIKFKDLTITLLMRPPHGLRGRSLRARERGRESSWGHPIQRARDWWGTFQRERERVRAKASAKANLKFISSA